MTKKKILLSWIGRHDLDEAKKNRKGPIASILLDSEKPFDEVRLLANTWFDELPEYIQGLARLLADNKRKAEISERKIRLSTPIDYPEIYSVAREELEQAALPGTDIILNLTSGTPAMVANWLLLGKGVFSCELWQTSSQNGLQVIELPFDVSVEYLEHQDERLQHIAATTRIDDSFFEHISCRSTLMRKSVDMAKRLSVRNVPTLILGESGSGKEVMAQAMHNASSRGIKPFIAVNCGAIPESLIDSHLFGHKKGSFTGADSNHKGFFSEANGGTLFLDEIGELKPDAQVKLLRVLQQKEITPVGASKPQLVDVRIIAATHRDLMAMVEQGSFREDLFYRLAVGVIQIPALRERREDIVHLVQSLMRGLNEEAKDQPGYTNKNVSNDAIEFIKSVPWPGNIRELWNTLVRASIWSEHELLSVDDISRAIIQRPKKDQTGVLNIDVSLGVDANKIIENTKDYLAQEALRIASGHKRKAAELLGLKNHQTLVNWIKEHNGN